MSKLTKMSTKRCKNPVNNHFVYNDETRKSTCKVCLFDMAGRHSENLMRHLKRKHPTTYAEVMQEKQRRRRSLNQSNRSGSAETGSIASMFEFEMQPHKFFIKSERLAFRLDEPGQQQLPIAKACASDYDDETAGGNGQGHAQGHGPFDAVDIGKEELCEVVHSPDGLNESSESFNYGENPLHPNPYQGKPQLAQMAPPGGQGQAMAGTSCSDDASFLQYLGDKFAKYTPYTRYTVQYHINRILYKADMGCYDNADASKLPDSFP